MVIDSTTPWVQQTEWLTVPDLTEILNLSPGRIRRLFEEKQLLAVRIENVLKVPALFLKDDLPLEKLAGTITLLFDSGYSNDEVVQWLLEPNELLGNTPIESLRAGRKSEVRRVAQSLAF
ncbi:MAG: Rv2175c family DNA-binding protein [Microbacteriaceae bacterium]